jgi:hypothetical protein
MRSDLDNANRPEQKWRCGDDDSNIEKIEAETVT